MTLYQFNVLIEDEKAAVLWSKGDFVVEGKEIISASYFTRIERHYL